MSPEKKLLTCVTCPKGCEVNVEYEGEEILNISGNACPQGLEYAKEEIVSPMRILPTTVVVKGGILPLVPVKTSKPIPRDLVLECMKELGKIKIDAPVKLGDVILADILGTGADIIATRDLPAGESVTYKKKN